jgi:hypothetical protein
VRRFVGESGGAARLDRDHERTLFRRCGDIGARKPAARLLALHAVERGADYPDPDNRGETDKSKVIAARSTAGSSQFDAAVNACRHLPPSSAPGPTRGEVQEVMSGMRNVAQCMRRQGVPNWPDPYLDIGRPTFDIHSIDYKARGSAPRSTNASI